MKTPQDAGLVLDAANHGDRSLEVADAGGGAVDGDPEDTALEGRADVGSDGEAEPGVPDGRTETDSGGGSIKLLAGRLGGTGNVDGIGAAAHFSAPDGVVSDGAGNLFVVDSHNHTIRKIVIATGEVTTLAGAAQQPGYNDGTGAGAHFLDPRDIWSDGAGNLFVTDGVVSVVRRVVIATGEVTTLAGSSTQEPGSSDGTAAAARFYEPDGIAGDGAGHLFVADTNNYTIRKIVIATAEVTTLAGSPGQRGSNDGTGAAARFSGPTRIASDGAGNLLVTDNKNQTIRKVVIATGEVTTLAGSPGQRGSGDGTGATALFADPKGIASVAAGDLFVADGGNGTIRKVVIATGEVTTFAGSPGYVGSSDGIGPAARFDWPNGVASDPAGNAFVADTDNHTIRKIVIATGEVTTLAGSPGQSGSSDGTGTAARFTGPFGLATEGAGNLFVADNDTIRKVVVATGEVTTIAGSPGQTGSSDGIGAAAQFLVAWGVTGDGAGSLFVTDSNNCTVRKVVIATGEVTTFAGSAQQPGTADGTGTAARFWSPKGIASDQAGNLFVADTSSAAIRRVVIATGEVTTFAGSFLQRESIDGTGPAARFAWPVAVASDGAGNLFVADSNTVRKIVISTQTVTTVVGSSGRAGVAIGPLATAGLSSASALALGPAGELLIADDAENVILVAEF